mgnify:FL=1
MRQRCRCYQLGALSAVLWLSSAALAVEQSPAALRAAYLYQITKFASWPDDLLPAAAPIRICFVGAEVTQVSRIFADSTAARVIGGHPLHSERYEDWLQLRASLRKEPCHLVVAGTGEPGLVADERQHTLLIGFEQRWLKHGGMLALIQDGERINITVNRDQLELSRVRLEARFLRLAKGG